MNFSAHFHSHSWREVTAKLCIQEQAIANVSLTADTIRDAIDRVRGAVMIVYPMGLPPYDEVCISI